MGSTSLAPRSQTIDAPIEVRSDFGNVLAELVRDPERLNAIDPSKLSELLNVAERMKAESARMEFSRAFREAQGEVQPIRRRGHNLHTSSKYALLEDVLDGLMPVVNAHGFSISFSADPSERPEHDRIVMLLRHVGGHSERHTLDAPRDTKGPGGKSNKTDLHGIKSTLTYCQRTLLCSVWNLQLCADDDGNAGARVGPANGPITTEQRAEIERGMKETGGDWDRFYTAYGISGLDELQQSQFRDVIARLEQKRRGAK